MRTPKDHEVHINWQPINPGLSQRAYLGQFVADMARLYTVIANRPYTVSILAGETLIPLQDFVNQRIQGWHPEFHEKLALDGLSTWMDILRRPPGVRLTSRWLWPRE